MAETDNMQALVSRRSNRRQAQQAAQANQPAELSMADVGTFVAEATPIIGDAMAAKEVYDELQKDEPNYVLVGALGGAALIGMIPGIGDVAASAIRRGARGFGRQANEVADAATGYSQQVMNADDIIFRWEKGELSNAELRSQMREVGFPVETKRITRNRSGGELEVSTPDGQIVQWDALPRGYAEGGQVKSNNQMEFLFEEGGIADDGMNRDPISGNEVPSGSLAQEVRDDIPAQLSEGEYVVPADVVRYYGVKFFEDLRSDAKMGLNQMEQDGRIGGEPVDMEGEDVDLTPEEEAELNAIMGMAEGGTITNTYDRLPPQAVGNTGQEQQLAELDQQTRRAFEEGGDVPAVTQLTPDFSQFRPGYSFMGSGEYTPPVIEPNRNVTLYGPSGDVINLILPADQTRYDELKSQGYSETPTATAPTQEAAPQQDDSGNEGFGIPRATLNTNKALTGAYDFSPMDIDGIMDDPLAWGAAQLERPSAFAKGAASLAGLMGGPVIGLLAGGGMAAGEARNIAKTRAAIQYARAQGLDTANLEAQLAEFIEGSSFAVRGIVNSENMATGDNFLEDINAAVEAARLRRQNTAPEVLDLVRKRNAAIYEAIQNPNAQYDPGFADYLDDVSRGRTGGGWRGYATGNISGMDGNVAGVVAYDAVAAGEKTATEDYGLRAKAGRVDGRTLYRNAEGQLFVRSGFFGSRIELLDGDIITLDNGIGIRNNVTDARMLGEHLPSAEVAPTRSTRQEPEPAPQPQPQPQPQPSSGSDDDSSPSYSLDTSSYSPRTDYSSQPSYAAPSSNTGRGGSGAISAADVSWVNKGGFITRRKKK